MNVCSVQDYADMLLQSVLDDGKIAMVAKNYNTYNGNALLNMIQKDY